MKRLWPLMILVGLAVGGYGAWSWRNVWPAHMKVYETGMMSRSDHVVLIATKSAMILAGVLLLIAGIAYALRRD